MEPLASPSSLRIPLRTPCPFMIDWMATAALSLAVCLRFSSSLCTCTAIRWTSLAASSHCSMILTPCGNLRIELSMSIPRVIAAASRQRSSVCSFLST